MRKEKKRNFSVEKFEGDSDVVLLVSGPVDAPSSASLGPECAKLFEADYTVTLDLARVSSVDSTGLKVLNALWRLGATLTNVPADIARKIESAQHELRCSSWH